MLQLYSKPVPAAEEVAVETYSVTFDSSMSDEDFFKWLKLKGISQKDSKALSGRHNFKVYVTEY